MMQWGKWRRSGKPAVAVSVTHYLDLDDVVGMTALDLLGTEGIGDVYDKDGPWDLDAVKWTRAEIDRRVRQQLKMHGWERFWFMSDHVSEAFVAAVRARDAEVFPEAVPGR